MKGVIRLGDSTSHGGKVLEGYSGHMIMGKPVARVGDACSCPIQNHTNCTIAEGNPNHIVGGKAVAFQGCKTTCGATLNSSLTTYAST